MNIGSLKEIYKETASGATNVPIIFVDPDLFNGNNADDFNSFAKQVSEQTGASIDDVKTYLDNPDARDFVEGLARISKFGGPFSIAPGSEPYDDFCIVNVIDEIYLSEESYLADWFGLQQENLKEVRGTIEGFVKSDAKHEVKHCDQEEGSVLEGEVDSYREALKSDPHDVALTEILSAALMAPYQPAHAVTLPLDPKQTSHGSSEEHYAAAENTLYELDLEIVLALKLEGLDDAINGYAHEASSLLDEDPARYYDVIDVLIAKGAFDDTPLEKEYIIGHVEAARALLDFESMGQQDGPNTFVEQQAVRFLSENETPPPREQTQAERIVNDLHSDVITRSGGNDVQTSSGRAINTGSDDPQSSNKSLGGHYHDHSLNHEHSTYAGNIDLFREASEAGVGVDASMFEQGATRQQATIAVPEVLTH